MPFPAIGDYGPYADWTEDGEYSIGDIVYHEGYLYQLMGNPDEQDPLDPYVSIGENPKTATFGCKFFDESEVNTYKSNDYLYTETKTMRRWRLWDLPAGYHHAALRRINSAGLTFSESINTPYVAAFEYLYMIQVRAFCKVATVITPEDPNEPPVVIEDGYQDDRMPIVECSYVGYGINSGLNATYSDSMLETGNLIYSFTAIAMSRVDTDIQSSYERAEFEDQRSLVWMPNTIAPWTEIPSDAFEVTEVESSQGANLITLRSAHSSMQVFGRDFTWAELVPNTPPDPPSVVTTTGTTIAFTDNFTEDFDRDDAKNPASTSPDYSTDT